MESWKMLLKTGNKDFENRHWSQAQDKYQQAQDHLELLWSNDIENVQLLMGWVCCLHNLSSLSEAQEQPQQALQYLLVPHQRLMDLLNNPYYSEDMHLIAWRALKYTLVPLLTFSKKYATCDSCRESLKAIEHKLKATQPILH